MNKNSFAKETVKVWNTDGEKTKKRAVFNEKRRKTAGFQPKTAGKNGVFVDMPVDFVDYPVSLSLCILLYKSG